MINTSTTEGKIAVMQAYADGKQIEYYNHSSEGWEQITRPCWDWSSTDYRIYEEPVIPDEVPWESINPRWKFYARNESGFYRFFEELPEKYESIWCSKKPWTSDSVLNIKRGNQPWDKSLVKRPKDV